MPEFPPRPPRGHVSLSRRLALTLALCGLPALAPLAAAMPETPEGLAALLGVPTPAERLTAALPTVHLTRVPQPASVLVVTTQSAAQVAARYGVPAAAVDPLPHAEDQRAKVLRVRLPAPELRRPPVWPRSVTTHTVRPGETLASIASDAGLSLLDLLSANLGRASLDDLTPGEALFVPTAERGLLVRLKPGQTALSVIAGYRADLARTARANDVLPTALRPGDYLLLPGIQAESLYAKLVERRAARQEAERLARVQAQYQRYLAWQHDRLQALYDQQEKYEAYLAWKNSPERQRRLQQYERQVQFEAAQAAERDRQQAAQSLSVQPAGVNVSAAGHLAWPMHAYRITSRYGEADIDFHKQVFHGGVDLAAPAGTPIYASAAGTVTESGYGAYGMNVYTVQGDSTLIYGHLSRSAVSAGQTVQQGDLIGYVGCTGICTGPHLHFELRLAGQAVDPLALLP
ncbi:LysM peptidoglycan-binding domain-containing protein [Deinococcus metallilatus]|uniref:LysM peptidoglycan-binding domain-containing protein n=1 Tax=Deinococcus metallilatus TaxID=1211322 RepID=A0AAJ5K088_9DEIO|nr:peptidoglycan DD-metalloendopeptidase family protein [Deinococcus metallilatus]MBB5294097.1 murein DD-endopeptidase MepM/ murein hydrolase activator NlpD [Deinococcus metallilatus]QBY08882.1 LysM peptidoglycan-binding domain-containing protein [Deinococcus metallilatus]RXJ10026.1 LysM peptidoglycan-binding domain-containing protein [Deinococcus metallilatus]TLK28037.1 LysM peptidoglycan-binding domain-containing protein [Deinococcus metallilatus]GMA16567.1 peptidase M23 [Deinococcus metalli